LSVDGDDDWVEELSGVFDVCVRDVRVLRVRGRGVRLGDSVCGFSGGWGREEGIVEEWGGDRSVCGVRVCVYIRRGVGKLSRVFGMDESNDVREF